MRRTIILVSLTIALTTLVPHCFAINLDFKDGGTKSGFLNVLMSPMRAAKRILSFSTGGTADGLKLEAFKIFMRHYNKTYTEEEIPARMALFFVRRKLLEASTLLFQAGKSFYQLRENVYFDWTPEELEVLFGVQVPKNRINTREATMISENSERRLESSSDFLDELDSEELDSEGLMVKANNNIPSSKDWRQSGCIATPVNQKECGSCYAFATVTTIETMRCLKTGTSLKLSAQQIVDCSTIMGNQGCAGGWPTRALNYLQAVSVIALESCYPYANAQNRCALTSIKAKPGCIKPASPTDSAKISYKVLTGELDILFHVANTGPVITVMFAGESFVYYGKGIYDDPECSKRPGDVNHAVVIVGYGTKDGVDYWIIKNSWGVAEWGEQGYGLVRRGINSCSIGHWGWVITG